MIINYDFGKRRNVPCIDCDERGRCTMNCGPPIDLNKLKDAAEKAKASSRKRTAGPTQERAQ